MADICMCRTEECPRKSTCHRYTANPSEIQSYFVDRAWEGCEFYWKGRGISVPKDVLGSVKEAKEEDNE